MSSILKVDALQKSDGTDGVHIAGHVIQVQHHTSSTVVTYSGGSFQSFNMSYTFTPKYATSNIWLCATIAGEHYNYSDLGITYGIYVNGSQVYTSQYTDYHSADSSQNISQHMLQYYDTGFGSTSPRTYAILFAPSNAAGTARVNNYGAPSRMTLMEIAQ